MVLRFFAFERAEDDFGHTCWEGVASVREQDVDAMRHERDALLAALAARAPGPRGPLDDGGTWDWQWDEQREGDWWTCHLTAIGPGDWADALLDQ